MYGDHERGAVGHRQLPGCALVVWGERFELGELVEAVGIEPTSGNPQLQASTSIADLLYGVSSRGTPVGRIAAEPASLVSPLP